MWDVSVVKWNPYEQHEQREWGAREDVINYARRESLVSHSNSVTRYWYLLRLKITLIYSNYLHYGRLKLHKGDNAEQEPIVTFFTDDAILSNSFQNDENLR